MTERPPVDPEALNDHDAECRFLLGFVREIGALPVLSRTLFTFIDQGQLHRAVALYEAVKAPSNHMTARRREQWDRYRQRLREVGAAAHAEFEAEVTRRGASTDTPEGVNLW